MSAYHSMANALPESTFHHGLTSAIVSPMLQLESSMPASLPLSMQHMLPLAGPGSQLLLDVAGSGGPLPSPANSQSVGAALQHYHHLLPLPQQASLAHLHLHPSTHVAAPQAQYQPHQHQHHHHHHHHPDEQQIAHGQLVHHQNQSVDRIDQIDGADKVAAEGPLLVGGDIVDAQLDYIQDDYLDADDGSDLLGSGFLGPQADTIIPPPPIQVFPDFQSGLDAIRAWGKRHGVDYSLKKSIKNRNQEIHRYILMCTRHGKLDNTRKLKDTDRVRLKRGSKKMGCPMGLIYAATDRLEPQGEWTIRYKRGQTSFMHNHPPAQTALPGHRRLDCTPEVKRTILAAQQTGVSPTQTLAILRAQNPNISLTLQDIRNIRKFNVRNQDADKA